MNERQLAAVDAHGEVFVSAGAGTGKTSVLVERFVRAVCDEGLDVESVLVITYTRKAAGELRSRIRAALLRPRPARSRPRARRRLDLDDSRLLQPPPPRASVRGGNRPEVPRARRRARSRSSRRGVRAGARRLLRRGGEERLTLLATYGSRRLRKMLTGVYETLRSAGRPLVLELGEPADLPGRLETLREAAQCLLGDRGATENHVAAAQAALDLPSLPETLIDLAALRTRGVRAAGFEEARKNVERAALELAATRDKDLLQELLDIFTAEYAAGKERESALDFEDLQLLARDLLAGDPGVLETEQLRFRAIMVDEFQDTNALQCELIDLIAARPREGRLLRRGRVPVDLRLPACRRGRVPGATRRGRPAPLADRELPLAARGAGRGQPRVRRGVRRRLPAARGVGRVPRPRLRPPRRAADHRQGVAIATAASTGGGPRLAPLRGGSASSSTPGPRRRARSCCCSRPAPTPSGTRKSCGCSACRPTARPAAGTSGSSRSSTS